MSRYEACGFGEPAFDLLKDIDHVCHWWVWLSRDILAPFDGSYLSTALWQRCHGASPCQLAGDDCYGFCELVYVTLET